MLLKQNKKNENNYDFVLFKCNDLKKKKEKKRGKTTFK